MKNTFKFLGIITFIAIITFSMATCGDGGGGTPDPCAGGHSYSTIAATCTTDSIPGTCTRSGCGEVNPEAVEVKLGHHAPSGTEPTCILAGNSGTGICQRVNCGLTITGTVIPALGHNWNWAAYTNGIRNCQRASCSGTVGVGDTGPAGGIIFYVKTDGFTVQGYTGTTGSFTSYTAYYLEAAPVNQGTSLRWSTAGPPYPTIDSAANAIAIGTGKNNTALILAGDPTAPAALACKNYNGGGKSDWFLPSWDELNEMYKAKVANVAGIPTMGWFWSSSQIDNDGVWVQGLSNGSEYNYFKNYDGYVRAIRAF